MTEPKQVGAWGYGLATLSERDDRVLDTWYPEPHVGLDDAPAAPGTHRPGQHEGPADLAAATARDERRGVRTVVVLTVIGSLAAPPADAHDGYLRLHLLSNRLIAPH